MIQGEGAPVYCKNCGTQLFVDSNFCHKCGTTITLKGDKTKQSENEVIIEGDDKIKLVKLYHVYSIVNNFCYKGIYYDNLKINWFIPGREKPQVPFEHAIINYSELTIAARIHPENYLMERFTLEETESLKDYLTSVQKINAVVDELELPISENEKCYHALPSVSGTDFIALYKKENYSLHFKVEGIFNVKMADERVVSDDRATVISKIAPEDLKKFAREKEKSQQST